MNIADHVTSLETSRKLKELGVNQDSLFYWVENFPIDPMSGEEDENKTSSYSTMTEGEFYELSFGSIDCSAYTASELMGLLPSNIKGVPLFIKKHTENYEVGYFMAEIECFSEELVNSLGKVLIEVLERNIMELPE